MKKINFIIVKLLFCLSLHADENRNEQRDNNLTDSKSPKKYQDTKGIPQKIKSFFNGIVDDFQEFTIDNNLVNSKKD